MSWEFAMSKCFRGRWAILAVLAAGLILSNPASSADPKKKPEKAAPKLVDEKAVRGILDKELEVELDGQSVKEICLYLGETYGLAVRIDSAALKRLRPESMAVVGERQLVKDGPQANEIRNLYEMKIDIPISRGMTVADAIAEICTQLPGKWSYRVRNTSVLIGPAFEPAVAPGTHGDAPLINRERIMEQLMGESVSFSVTEMPLADSLQDLRKRTGANIVLDLKQAENAKTPVTGTFNDARLLTALQLLTDMAGLKVVSMNNVFYITDTESADKLQSDHNRDLFGDPTPTAPPAPCAGILQTRASIRR
jgi:hypothetical protein